MRVLHFLAPLSRLALLSISVCWFATIASAAPIFTAGVGNTGSDPGDCISQFPGGTRASPIEANVTCAGNGAGAAVAVASEGHVGASANALDFGFGGYGTSGSAFMAGDVIFTGVDPNAPIGTTHVSLNLSFAGTLNATIHAGAEAQGASFLFGTNIGSLDYSDFGGAFTCNSTYLGLPACGSAVKAPNISTDSILVPLNVLIPLALFVQVDVGTGALGDSALADFSNSLDFPIGSDVFGLVDGVTVNSADLSIVNNRFLPPNMGVPEPSSLLIISAALVALGLWLAVCNKRA